MYAIQCSSGEKLSNLSSGWEQRSQSQHCQVLHLNLSRKDLRFWKFSLFRPTYTHSSTILRLIGSTECAPHWKWWKSQSHVRQQNLLLCWGPGARLTPGRNTDTHVFILLGARLVLLQQVRPRDQMTELSAWTEARAAWAWPLKTQQLTKPTRVMWFKSKT